MANLTVIQWENLGSDFLEPGIIYQELTPPPFVVFRQAVWDCIVETNDWHDPRFEKCKILIHQVSDEKIMEYHKIISDLEDKMIDYKVSFYLDDDGLVVIHL